MKASTPFEMANMAENAFKAMEGNIKIGQKDTILYLTVKRMKIKRMQVDAPKTA